MATTADYAVTGGSATGADYSLSAGTVTIPAGSTTANLSLAIINDILDENDETVILTLTNPTNATLGANQVYTYTITDNDATPSVSFTSAGQVSAGESGVMTITAQLSAVSSLAVTVPYR